MPRRKAPLRSHWSWKRLSRLPAANHPVWPFLRLGVLVVAMYANATHFDMTEGHTIIAVALMEALGLRRKP